ncbi:sialate:O-sulfotransferase 1 isoform X2 [Pseudorasbora parva]|uniref:sialate:O-sulfotransferase 1 isoform X2 n=1 Tax=Pseudorasbora parva TaxID=51549 RepID=UPI00351EDEEC
MAKPSFLRRAQLLLFFLGVAYIMAGSMLLLQRSSLVTFQRETDTMALPSLPAPPRDPEVPAARWLYRRNFIQEMKNQPLEQTDNIMDQKHLISRNLEIRHLRRHWFYGNAEQKSSSKHNLSHKEARRKGTYIGCFINNETEHALGGTVLYDFRKMTSTLCQDTCSESGFRYAGLEYGAECHCGNRVCSRRARGEDCNLDCRGEKGSPCGGVERMSVYRVEDRLPGQRRYRTVHYHGCYERPKNSTADFLTQTSGPTHTPQQCIETCTDQDLPLALLRGQDCFCSHAQFLFTIQMSEQEHVCERGNKTNHTSLYDLDYYWVYSTPVLDATCKERTFLPQKSRTLVALSSFPGAGNTWLRHLIELATGFYTGSYYFDGSLYNKEWSEFVDSYSTWWASHALAWLRFAHRLLVVHFENLQKDLILQLKSITAFLNTSIPEERLLCTESNRDGHFKRSGSRSLTFDPFTPEMRARIDKYIHTVDKALRDRNISGLPQEYMPR